MRPSKSFVVRLVIYSLALLWIAGDLFVFHGPLRRKVDALRPDSAVSIERARSQGIVARVFGEPILLSQVERAARERLWLRGRTMDELRPGQRRTERLAALNELIDHQLLRTKVKHHGGDFPVADEEIDEAVRQLASRYPTKDAMKADLEAEGIDSEKELRYRLAARIQQLKWIESRIAEGIEVGEEEAREWFAEHADQLVVPERVRVRHVFLSTLERDPALARATLAEALGRLRSGAEDFAALAAGLSEDERTKRAGGELGWMTRERLPEDFATAVFAMPVGTPELVRSRIGWHLVEVLEHRAAEPRGFDEAREEVFAALESMKRKMMVERWREALRARESDNIQVFADMIGEP